MRSGRLGFCGAAVLAALALTSMAQAQDFFGLFGGFGYRSRQPMTPFGYRPQPPVTPLPYSSEGYPISPEGDVLVRPRSAYSYFGGSQAYCVRTCDGRHFPIASSGNQSMAASCSNLCPATETAVVYGSDIDNAVTESGKSYSELPNAYRYRDELVQGCTCNGKDPTGLAQIKIEDDPTLRKGDIVAGGKGLMVAGRGADRRGASLNLSPATRSIRSHYRRVPIVAAQ
jgi:hypothetical protein